MKATLRSTKSGLGKATPPAKDKPVKYTEFGRFRGQSVVKYKGKWYLWDAEKKRHIPD